MESDWIVSLSYVLCMIEGDLRTYIYSVVHTGQIKRVFLILIY